MDLDYYQEQTAKTAPRSINVFPECVQYAHAALKAQGDHGQADALVNLFEKLVYCLGLAGEVGEFLDVIKKEVGHGHPASPETKKKELGDVHWYLARLEAQEGYKASEVCGANLEKLEKRYKEGFSAEASINRTS